MVPVVAGSSPVRHPRTVRIYPLLRPRSSADRAADFESARGGSTPPGATRLAERAPVDGRSGTRPSQAPARLRRYLKRGSQAARDSRCTSARVRRVHDLRRHDRPYGARRSAQRRCEHGRLPRPVRPRGDRRCGESADRPARQARVERDRGVARRVVLRRDLRPRRATRCLSVACRRRLARLLSAPLRRARPPRLSAGAARRGHPLGRRHHRLGRGRGDRLGGAARGRAPGDGGHAERGRDEPRLSRRRRAPALRRLRHLRPLRVARGAPVARPRGRRPRDGDRRRHLPVPARHVRGGLRPGHPLACVRAPDRGRRMGRGS